MKKVLVALMALMMMVSLVACGGAGSDGSAAGSAGSGDSDSYIDQIKAKGELVVGTSADYPPYEFHTEIDGVDTIVGFDIAIAQAIADDLGVELKIVDMSFDNLLMSLVTNLQVITPALSLTQGGPGTGSYFMCYMLYTQAFKSHKYGYGSAIAVILFLIIAVFTGILFATSKGWIFYEGDEKE